MSTAIGASMASTSSATAPRSASATASAACSSTGAITATVPPRRRRLARRLGAADRTSSSGATATHLGVRAGAADGTGGLDPGRRRREQPVGDVHDLGRRAVVDRERHPVRRDPHGQVGDHVVPARQRTRAAGLAEVADQGHRSGRAAPGEHAPLHRAEVLRLVDEHVAEGARLAVVVGRSPATRRSRSGRARRRRW